MVVSVVEIRAGLVKINPCRCEVRSKKWIKEQK